MNEALKDASKDSGSSTQNDNATTNLPTTTNEFLAYWGLKESDVLCTNCTRLDITSYDLDTKEVHEIGAYTNAKQTEADERAWFDKVIAKLKKLSDDDKVTDLYGEEMTTDIVMSKSIHITGGYVRLKGKQVGYTLTSMPGYLDNSDPDEAMAAYTIEID